MNHPGVLHISGTLRWVLRLFDPSDGATLVDADSTPAGVMRKSEAGTTRLSAKSTKKATGTQNDRVSLTCTAFLTLNPLRRAVTLEDAVERNVNKDNPARAQTLTQQCPC